jgi:hypothetical protein
MAILRRRRRPESWPELRSKVKSRWLIPVLRIESAFSWLAYLLSGWAFLEVIEYLGTFSLLLAAISYFTESRDRIKQKDYQAWQVINAAQGKGGSGGRIDAMEELHDDGVPLVGVDVSGAFLEGIDLNGANLKHANFRSADIEEGAFIDASLQNADLKSANLRNANLSKARLQNANLEDANLLAAKLRQADLAGVHLSKADLRNADLQNIKWQEIADIKLANVFGVKNAPTGFLDWAAKMGAVSVESDAGWLVRFNLD